MDYGKILFNSEIFFTGMVLKMPWEAILILNWIRSRLFSTDHEDWAWTIITNRWGNPSQLVGDHAPPGFSGDRSDFHDYRHLQESIKSRFRRFSLDRGRKLNYDMVSMQDLQLLSYVFIIEVLILLRTATVVVLVESILILIVIGFEIRTVLKYMNYWDPFSREVKFDYLVKEAILRLAESIKCVYVLLRPNAILPEDNKDFLITQFPNFARMYLSHTNILGVSRKLVKIISKKTAVKFI